MKKYTSQTTARRRWDTGQDEGNYQGDGTRPLRGIAAIGNMYSTVPNAYTFQQTAALWVRSVTAAASSPAVKQHRRPNVDVGEFNLSVAEDAEVHELHACSGQTGFEDYHNSKRCSSLSDVQWCGLCVLFCLFVCLFVYREGERMCPCHPGVSSVRTPVLQHAYSICTSPNTGCEKTKLTAPLHTHTCTASWSWSTGELHTAALESSETTTCCPLFSTVRAQRKHEHTHDVIYKSHYLHINNMRFLISSPLALSFCYHSQVIQQRSK